MQRTAETLCARQGNHSHWETGEIEEIGDRRANSLLMVVVLRCGIQSCELTTQSYPGRCPEGTGRTCGRKACWRPLTKAARAEGSEGFTRYWSAPSAKARSLGSDAPGAANIMTRGGRR